MAGQEGVPHGAPRGGARRGAKPKRSLQPAIALLGLGSIAALVAWGVLVWFAIGFGRDARGGDSAKWIHLAVSSVAAVGCLFLCLLLLTFVLRRIGVLEDRRPHRH